MRFIRSRKIGFSLIELLVVTAMLGVVSLAIYSTFNNGFKVWQKINKSLVEEDLGIFFDKLSQDLNNCLKSSSIPFTGNESGIGIPTQVYSSALKAISLGMVTYFYDPQGEALSRQPKDFSQLYSRQEDNPVVLLKNVEFFKFEYYCFDGQKQEYSWKEEWSGNGIPLAVRVSINLNDSSGTSKFIRTIQIPIGA